MGRVVRDAAESRPIVGGGIRVLVNRMSAKRAGRPDLRIGLKPNHAESGAGTQPRGRRSSSAHSVGPPGSGRTVERNQGHCSPCVRGVNGCGAGWRGGGVRRSTVTGHCLSGIDPYAEVILEKRPRLGTAGVFGS